MKGVCNAWYWLDRVKTCSLANGTGCRMSKDVQCGLYEPEPKPLQGWVCPRCGKVWSPFASNCDCFPPTYTMSTINPEPNT